ncbi:MAG: HlyD family efflux transporter periplasmic adaptor subunit, partial [Magnetococcus sp. WYHC-3]
QGPELRQEWAAAWKERSGLLRQQRELRLEAPFAGRVVRREEGLEPGQWASRQRRLLILADEARWVVRGYVTAAERERLTTQSTGRFYPDDPWDAPLPVHLERVDESAVARWERHELAADQGGDRRVRSGGGGGVEPVEPLYPVVLTLPTPLQRPARVLRGQVVLSGRTAAPLGQGVRDMAAAFMDELLR